MTLHKSLQDLISAVELYRRWKNHRDHSIVRHALERMIQGYQSFTSTLADYCIYMGGEDEAY